MLVLSRHPDEAIMIGDDVEIVVVDIRGDKVRLGVNAPPSVAVHRKEIFEAIRQENAHAAELRAELGLAGRLGLGGKTGGKIPSAAETIRAMTAGQVRATA